MATIKTLLLILLMCCYSCCTNYKKEKKNLKKDNTVPSNILDLTTLEVKGEDTNLRYHLPKSISLKDTLKGHLVYKSSFDTILTDSLDVRDVKLYVAKLTRNDIELYRKKNTSFNERYEKFKLKKLDTFMRILDSIIPIFDFTFNKKGYHAIEGYIIDDLYLDEDENIRKKSVKNHFIYEVLVK